MVLWHTHCATSSTHGHLGTLRYACTGKLLGHSHAWGTLRSGSIAQCKIDASLLLIRPFVGTAAEHFFFIKKAAAQRVLELAVAPGMKLRAATGSYQPMLCCYLRAAAWRQSASHPLRICLQVGLGEGFAPSAATSVLAWQVPSTERSRAVTTVWGGLDVGSAVGLLLSGPLIRMYGWPSVFYLFAVLGGVWCLLWPLVRPDKQVGRCGRAGFQARSCAIFRTVQAPGVSKGANWQPQALGL